MAAQETQTFHSEYDDLEDSNFQIRGRTLLYVVVLFSIILLITFLFFLYGRLIVRFRSFPLFQNSPPSPQPQGLDAAMINSLPVTVHRRAQPPSSETTETSECCICLGIFEEGEKVKALPSCSHSYHCECVDKWLITHSSCPICRASLRVDSPV